MIKSGIIILFLVSLTNLSKTHAQSSDLGYWWIYFGNKSLGERFNLHHEVQYRNYNIIGDLEQLLLRAGVGYNLTENNNNILLGYGYILSENYSVSDPEVKHSINEHRIYQQFITKQNILCAKVQHRYRFEQRFVEDNFRMRFRYFLAIKIPLGDKDFGDNTLYLSGYNELFIVPEKNNVFDRNRLYGGLGYKVNSSLKFELGYMNQFFSAGGRDQINVIASVSF